MPIEVGLWRVADKPERLKFSPIQSEKLLEEVLAKDISVLSAELMLIGRQVPTAHGKYIDMLGIDAEGNLAIIELKRNRTPRDVVAQVIDYASWVQNLSYDEVRDIYVNNNHGSEFEAAFAKAFGCESPPEEVNKSHQLLVVAAELDRETERIIGYLADNYAVPINAVFFRHFEDAGNRYLVRSWLIDPSEVDAKAAVASGPRKRETWNGQDFYVAFGEDENRVWEDARRYGFISAGGGRWYTRTLEQLFPGARVFAMIPKTGYVGVGKVVGPAVPAKEFRVEVNGADLPFLDAPLSGHYLRDETDPNLQEVVVPVEWIKTVPTNQAFWQTGMFANQNSACRLRNQFTLERLSEFFELTE